MPIVRIPTPLRAYTNGQSDVPVSGSTVGEALWDLLQQHPGLRPHLYSNETLRPYVNLFLGEDNIRDLSGMETALQSSDRLMIIPSIAGGKEA
jgi:molybdopterin converting factor small subunit